MQWDCAASHRAGSQPWLARVCLSSSHRTEPAHLGGGLQPALLFETQVLGGLQKRPGEHIDLAREITGGYGTVRETQHDGFLSVDVVGPNTEFQCARIPDLSHQRAQKRDPLLVLAYRGGLGVNDDLHLES